MANNITPTDSSGDPTKHYNTVVEAWDHLLGEDLHYGYFRTGGEPLTNATDALTDEMLSLAQLEAGMDVLDIGCGTGKAGCRVAHEFKCQVMGISPSSACIDRASALSESLGLFATAKFQLGDGTQLQFEDGSFDRVWVMESSHLMDDKAALLRECARVLKPGGRMVLCDVMLRAKLSLPEVIARRDEFLILKDAFGRAKMETLAFYQSQLEGNQLQLEHARDISIETLATFGHWRENARANRSQVEQHIGEQACDSFLASCDVLESFWQESIMGYGIISASKAA
ncbi:MAG: methyltransferase domain-containing protein [Halioglobus sp.]